MDSDWTTASLNCDRTVESCRQFCTSTAGSDTALSGWRSTGPRYIVSRSGDHTWGWRGSRSDRCKEDIGLESLASLPFCCDRSCSFVSGTRRGRGYIFESRVSAHWSNPKGTDRLLVNTRALYCILPMHHTAIFLHHMHIFITSSTVLIIFYSYTACCCFLGRGRMF